MNGKQTSLCLEQSEQKRMVINEVRKIMEEQIIWDLQAMMRSLDLIMRYEKSTMGSESRSIMI